MPAALNVVFSMPSYRHRSKPFFWVVWLIATGAWFSTHAATLYVSAQNDGKIAKFDLQGNFLGFLTTGLALPSGMAADAAGNIIVANESNGVINKITPAGEVSFFAMTGNGPEGVAIDEWGDVFVAAEHGNVVYRFASNGQSLGPISYAGFASPHQLAFDTEGNLYVANLFNNTISKVTFTPGPNRQVVSISTFIAVNEGGAPIGVAFDAGGNVYVSFWRATWVKKYNAVGQYLGVFCDLGVEFNRSLTFDSSGNLFVANEESGVFKLDSSGALLAHFGTNLQLPLGVLLAAQSGPMAPPIITSITRLANGHILLSGTGTPGQIYNVQGVVTLDEPFEPPAIATITATVDGPLQFEDVNAGSYLQRFYRLTAP